MKVSAKIILGQDHWLERQFTKDTFGLIWNKCNGIHQKVRQISKFFSGQSPPPTEMVLMTSPWPFAQWGIDVLEPLPQAPLQRKFLIVTIDYFTKWIEAEPLAKITERNTKNFVRKSIVCRLGILRVIISNNAKQFNNDRFKLFCSNLAISNHFSSSSHPQANIQVEVTNRTILRKPKGKVEKSKSEWAEDHLSVLGAYHMTSRILTSKIP